MMVGFVSPPDEHAPSVKSRVRRVLHAQRTDQMKPPRSAPPAGVDTLAYCHYVMTSLYLAACLGTMRISKTDPRRCGSSSLRDCEP